MEKDRLRVHLEFSPKGDGHALPSVEVEMIDRQELAEFARQIKGREDVTIRTGKMASGGVKALVYSGFDRCFHVTVDGRERMCSDIPDTVCQFFNGLSPG